MSRLLVAIALLFLSAAHADEPQWLKDARAREGQPAVPVSLKSKDGWFTARIPYPVTGDVVKEQDSYTINFNLGADTPMQCEIVPDGFDMADRLSRTLEVTVSRLEKAQGKVEQRQLDYTDAGAMGNVPYLESRWLIRVNDGKESRVGGLKQIALEKYGHGIYCAHFDIGFVKSFHEVAHALAETFEAPPVSPPPYYVEISTASIDGRKIGVTITRLEQDKRNATKATQLTALLLPGTAGVLHTQDALRVDWIKQDGSLLNASQTVAQDGELITDAELNRTSSGWSIHGKVQGSTLALELPASAEPASWVSQARARRILLTSGSPIGVVNSVNLWTPPALDGLTTAKTRVLARTGPDRFTAHATSGTIEADLTLDAKTGMPTSIDYPMGDLKIHVERVFASGNF